MKSFFTFLSRNKLYAAIEIVGMSVAIAFVIFIATFVIEENSTDRDIKNKGNYCVGDSGGYFIHSYPVKDILTGRFPEIEEMCRMMSVMSLRGVSLDVLTAEGNEKQNALVVDDNFFEMFPIPLKEGNPAEVLKGDQVVLSEEYAHRLFPEGSAVGKNLKIRIEEQEATLVVSGVFPKFRNTILPSPNFIYHFDQIRRLCPTLIHEGNGTVALFFRLQDGVDIEALSLKVDEVLQKEEPLIQSTGGKYKLVAWDKISTSENVMTWTPFVNVLNSQFVRLFTAVGILLLVFAVLNYISLTTAQAGFRAKEMATRRLLGTSQLGVVGRNIAETFLLALFSFALALVVVKVALPYVQELIQRPIDPFDKYLWVEKLSFGVMFLVLLSFCAGIIPASILSKFKPIEIVRGTFARVSKMRMGRILVGVQCLVAFITLSMSLVMAVQLKYMLDKPLGYRLEGNIAFPYVNRYSDFYVDELRQLPMVDKVGFILNYPMQSGVSLMTFPFAGNTYQSELCYLDREAFDILGFEVVNRFSEPLSGKLWVTSEWMSTFNLNQETIGNFFRGQFDVCGEIKDYQKGSVCSKGTGFPKLLYLLDMKDGKNYMYIRRMVVQVKGDEEEAVRQIREFYKAKGMEQYDRIISFREMNLDLYSSEASNLSLLMLFSLITVLLTALSLVAMSTYYARQHTKAMAIRKIFGGSKHELFLQTVGGFLRSVVVAIVVGSPIAWWLTHKWLEDYSYRIDHVVWCYFVAGAILLFVSVVAISWQIGRLVIEKPVNSLKKE